jgi:hypothetical protein
MTHSARHGRKFKRRHSWRSAKTHWVYTLPDICRLFGVTRNTPLNWMRQGLTSIDGAKPIAVEGKELNRFHKQRWLDSKRPLGEGELYCRSCDRPRRPHSGQIKFKSNIRGAGSIIASCEQCGSALELFVSPSQAARFLATYSVNTAPEDND